MMTYQQALDYLYSQLPMYHRVGDIAFKKGLGNIEALCAHLHHPHTTFPTIHIAGTNGKGSCTHFIAAILQAAGYKVGVYVSPHYIDFRERIKINGTYISQQAVIDFITDNDDLLKTLQPSFFEMTVALAFHYFSTQQVDIAVVETGLGGRLDSTNIITPLVSLITNISYDHTQMLGNTLAEIAFEKAGIIKAGIPVVVGERNPETDSVFITKAKTEYAPICFAQDLYTVTEKDSPHHTHSLYDVHQNGILQFGDLKLNAKGSYQLKNLRSVLATIHILRTHTTLHIPDTALTQGLAQVATLTAFMGRWQIIQTQPFIICDSSHNLAGIHETLQGLAKTPHQRAHIVFGMVKDKDRTPILSLLPPHAQYYFACPNIPRGLAADILAADATQLHLHGAAYPSVQAAFRAALQHTQPADLLLVCGSIFVTAEVLAYLQDHPTT